MEKGGEVGRILSLSNDQYALLGLSINGGTKKKHIFSTEKTAVVVQQYL